MINTKKVISLTLIFAVLISAFSFSVFAENSYSKYTLLGSFGTLDEAGSTLSNASKGIMKGDIIKVYIGASLKGVSKDKVTAFHLLGTTSDNLKIVGSGFAADEAITEIGGTAPAIQDGIPDGYKNLNKMIHNSKTADQNIDFTAVVMPNTEGNAIKADENSNATLIWLELEVVGTGLLTIKLDNSYVRTAFDAADNDNFTITGDVFSQRTYQVNDDGGKRVPTGTVRNPGKAGSIDKVTVANVDGAETAIDQGTKKISITLPEGTDASDIELNVSITGVSVSYKKGDKLDLTEPKEITVKGTDGKEVVYTIEATVNGSEPVKPDRPTADSEYSDVEKNRWSHDMIDALVKSGLVDGYGKDENGKLIIRPTGLITREEAAKLSVSAYGLDVDASATLNFADASDVADWAVPYVAAGANHPNKMIRGYEDNTFRAKGNVTREELVAMIINTFGFGVDENPEIKYADADEISWSAGYISKAVSLGIVLGYEDNTFKPAQSVTREEAFAMFERALKIYKSLTE